MTPEPVAWIAELEAATAALYHAAVRRELVCEEAGRSPSVAHCDSTVTAVLRNVMALRSGQDMWVYVAPLAVVAIRR